MKRFIDSHIQGTNTQLHALAALDRLATTPKAKKLVKVLASATSDRVIKKAVDIAAAYLQSEANLAPDQAAAHPEKGKFKKVVHNKANGFTLHQAPGGDKVHVQTVQSKGGRAMAKVTHITQGKRLPSVGSHTKMSSLLTQKFGIKHSILNKSAAKVV